MMSREAWALIADHERRRARDPVRRKQEGAFYTPPELARSVVRRALEPFLPARDLADLRLLDPALGGGTFLLAAIDVLVEAGLAPARAARCCAGRDRDPEAVAVARQAIRLHTGGAEADLRACDVLLEPPQPVFDVVVGNPPWEKIARDDPRKEAFDTAFSSIREGETNLHALFLVWGLRSLKPGGRLAMITPNTWLLNRWDSRLRRHLLDCGVAEVAVLPAGTFPSTPVTVPAVVVVGRPDAGGAIRVSAPGHRSTTRAAVWSGRPHAEMSVFDDAALGAVERKMRANSVPLGDVARASDGIYTSTARRFAKHGPAQPGDRPVLLAGSELACDLVFWAGAHIPESLWGKHAGVQGQDRLVLHAARHPALARRLVGAVVPGGVFTSNRFINVVSAAVDPCFLAAVLLSRPVDGYFARRFPVADVDAYMLHQVPVPRAEPEAQGRLASWVRLRAQLRGALTGAIAAGKRPSGDLARMCHAIDRRIEGAVADLFGLTPADVAAVASGSARGLVTGSQGLLDA